MYRYVSLYIDITQLPDKNKSKILYYKIIVL